MRAIALCLALAVLPGPTPQAATGCAADAMLVFDGSGSMAEVGHDPTAATRIIEARAALRRVMPDVAPYRRIGLLSYGAGGSHPCSGITRHFAPMPDAAAAVVVAVDALMPGGLTPIAASVAAAAEVLEYRTQPGIVVLVTDGNETCGGTPCALGAALTAEARDLTVHVIGFRVVHDPFSWNSPEAQGYDGQTVAKCLADATGGVFVSTETVDELVDALRETLGCPLIGGLGAGAPPRGRG
ncbi:vWA domain-containing protein [Roseovarius sp. MS2]|uniref:von Willebrand factor type A domain protein n=1 Tax=Roseovarius mucosus TaxID=215743 RepID=A0A1V0RNT6_9RHOB|nr:VWA domain-containing protein [Roseovarius mucosus]ARE83448.1 von Willebrand factor type A domain protein [Roseovarius mucosus]